MWEQKHHFMTLYLIEKKKLITFNSILLLRVHKQQDICMYIYVVCFNGHARRALKIGSQQVGNKYLKVV